MPKSLAHLDIETQYTPGPWREAWAAWLAKEPSAFGYGATELEAMENLADRLEASECNIG